MTKSYKYKAFISYSHDDKAWAAKLLRSLESYRLPKRLRKARTDGTVAPARIGMLFRDRDEFPAAEDLTAEVRRALTQSEFMIVLCSPAAAASRWVNREIIEFKKLNGEGKILSVILSGEPFATDKANPEEECFPPALRFKLDADGRLTKNSAEPLAADLRPDGDGYRRGLLKLVAGLLGIGLDTLIERDLQRKMGRVTAVTAASLIAMLGMGALTYEAITARQEAEKARGEAEGLIEFMLTDLKDKLREVGRLDVLDAVGDRAVAYYGRQTIDEMPADSLGRRSRAFHLLGEVENLRGDLDSAQIMFDNAAASTAGLLARKPNDTQRIYEHAQSMFWLGLQKYELGNYAGARDDFQEYYYFSNKLAEAEPASIEYKLELMLAHSNLGTVHFKGLGEPEKAINEFNQMLRLSRELVDYGEKSGEGLRFLLSDLAESLAWIGTSQELVASESDVLKARTEQKKLLSQLLRSNPSDADTRLKLVACNRALGRANANIGKKKEALKHYHEAILGGQSLYQSETDNKEKRDFLALAVLDMAHFLILEKEFQEARSLISSYQGLLMTFLTLGRKASNTEVQIRAWLDTNIAALILNLGRPPPGFNEVVISDLESGEKLPVYFRIFFSAYLFQTRLLWHQRQGQSQNSLISEIKWFLDNEPSRYRSHDIRTVELLHFLNLAVGREEEAAKLLQEFQDRTKKPSPNQLLQPPTLQTERP